MDVGERVGVVSHEKDGRIFVIGYGTFLGDEKIGIEATGPLADMLRMVDKPNPKIQLDNGKIVWGCEVWWAPEDQVKDYLHNTPYEIVNVDIDILRRDYMEKRLQ